jgi:hypothetical protein
MRALPLTLLLAALATVTVPGQELDFQAAERKIVRLPPAAFPALPAAVVRELQRRGCTIPQADFKTQADFKMPNNVVSGEFARRGQRDWAVLCSMKGASSILVFWNGSPANPADLGRSDDINYLQGGVDNKIMFSRGIGAVGADFILKHHQVYGGAKPPRIDHQGIDDAFILKASVVRYFFDGNWLELTGSD